MRRDFSLDNTTSAYFVARASLLYWANSKDGMLGQPTFGEFKNGCEFYDQEVFNVRAVLVRFIWSDITPNSAHFEQAFSIDGGKTWAVNWITDQTRTKEKVAVNHAFRTASARIDSEFSWILWVGR